MALDNLASDFVSNIPWDKNPNFAFQKDLVAYEKAFENIRKEIPTKDLKIDFSDDVWDFNPYFRNSNRIENKIDFTKAPEEIKDVLKYFVLYKMSNGTKPSTLFVRVGCFISILNGVMSNARYKRVSIINTNDIVSEIEKRKAGPATSYNLYAAAFQVYRFIQLNYMKTYPVDINELQEKALKKKALAKNQDNKIPNIPDELFAAIVDTASKVMRDENAPLNDRVIAAIIVVLSQTGFRIADLLALEVDQIFEKRLSKSGLLTNYIHYKEEKPSKLHGETQEFDIFCNELCFEAITILKDLRDKTNRTDMKNWLVVIAPVLSKKGKPPKKAAKLPLSRHSFNYKYKSFLYKYLYDYVSQEWEGIPSRVAYHYDYNLHKMVSELISVPETRQYRVRVCTDLYNRGIPLVYIQRFMGHLTEYMLGYYVRPKDHSQENAQYTAKLIRDIDKEELSLLGHPEGAIIVSRVKKFISEGKYNVETDMDELISALGDKFVVRGKEGGVCIKTSMLPCPREGRTDEVLCAAGVCPNLYHVYYMIDITYRNYLTLLETHKKAASEGRTAEAKKEHNKLKNIARNRLLPELDDLESQILKFGEDNIVDRHPNLKAIIAIRQEIRKEAEKWLSHKYYDIADTYAKCKTRAELLQDIIDRGNESEVKEEKRLFRNYIERTLVMELGELEIQIKKYGKDEVVKRHPELLNVVTNLERELKEDIKQWRKMAPTQ